MNREFSTYLDVLRIGAAATVFVGHLSWMAVSGGFLWQAQRYGHSAVIIFFVLSGFVISYAADTKERTLFDFSVARLARLYSVVLPAILLTLVCDTIGTHHNPGVYDMTRETNPLWRVTLGALFLTQSWGHTSLLSNEAYWSLPYEFWYYAMFAAVTFLKGWQRVLVLAVCCAIAGPGILIMTPVWAAGVAAYRLSRRVTLRRPVARAAWIASAIAGAIALIQGSMPSAAASLFLPAGFSAWDFLLGALVAVNIFSASSLSFGLAKFHGPISAVAGRTFALYLFHLPLLHLAAAYLPAELPAVARGSIEAVLVLCAVYALSFISEGQKHRWRNAIRRLLHPFAAPASKGPAA